LPAGWARRGNRQGMIFSNPRVLRLLGALKSGSMGFWP
jgi:hypothetical protein